MPTPFAKELRQMRGLLNQEQFAAWVGVSRVTIARLETGGELSLSTARKLVARGMDPAVATAAALPSSASGRAA